MKNKILGGMVAVAIAAVAAWNVNVGKEGENGLSALSLANVEALAQSESGGEAKWIREDGDCVYSFTGRAGAKITIFGGITITIGADGTATYTESGGKTHCTAGGSQQCTARYCRPLS